MKSFLFSLAAIAALGLSTQANAQSLSPVGSASVTANLDVKQTLSFFIPCNFTLGASVSSASAVTTTFASALVPYTLCTFLFQPISATSDWLITPTSYTSVTISNVTVDALDGKCWGSVTGVVTSTSPLRIRIDEQSIDGVDGDNNTVRCFLKGTATLNGVNLI